MGTGASRSHFLGAARRRDLSPQNKQQRLLLIFSISTYSHWTEAIGLRVSKIGYFLLASLLENQGVDEEEAIFDETRFADSSQEAVVGVCW